MWEGLTEKGPGYDCQDCYGVDTGNTGKRRSSLTALTPYAPDLDMLMVDHTLEALESQKGRNNMLHLL